jgi:hypothetical protein
MLRESKWKDVAVDTAWWDVFFDPKDTVLLSYVTSINLIHSLKNDLIINTYKAIVN